MIVKLRQQDKQNSDLTFDQHYIVIGIEANALRILNDHGRPYLYPRELFDIIDLHEPDDWITEFGEGGERYSYPLPLNHSGFFEDFFDNKPKAVTTFGRVVSQHLATAATWSSTLTE